MKKLVSILLIVTLLLSMVLVAVPASAAEAKKTAKVAAGYVPFDANENGLYDDGAIGITDANGLAAMAAGGKYYLKNDITLTSTYGFGPALFDKSTYLDGCGHTIDFDSSVAKGTGNTARAICQGISSGLIYFSNLNVTGVVNALAGNTNHVALFTLHGYCADFDNVVVDVDLTVNSIGTSHAIGMIWGKNEGHEMKLNNVHTYGSITVNCDVSAGGYGGVGAFMGAGHNVTFTNCSNNATITVNGKANAKGIAGFVGTATGSSLTFNNCENNGNIIYNDNGAGTETKAAGFIGESTSTVNMTACVNNGNITANKTGGGGTKLGGFIANQSDQNITATFTNCVNTGDVKCVGPQGSLRLGGFIGESWWGNVVIDGGANHGDIIYDSSNTTTVGNEILLGGAVGCKGANSITVKNGFVNNGDITVAKGATEPHLGGIVGVSCSAATDIQGTTNNGAITNNSPKELGITFNSTENKDEFNTFGGYLGGIIGCSGIARYGNTSSSVIIKNCTNNGPVSNVNNQSKVFVGGIMGKSFLPNATAYNLTIEGCTNSGAIKNGSYFPGLNIGTAGILGSVKAPSNNLDNSKVTIKDCTNAGTINVAEDTYSVSGSTKTVGDAMHVGGIIGKILSVHDVEINGCINAGAINLFNSTGWNGASGIVGSYVTMSNTYSWAMISNASLVINDCHNLAAVTSGNGRAGGLLGATYQVFANSVTTLKFSNCTNEGTITGYGFAGGMIGHITPDYESDFTAIAFENCINRGAVTATKSDEAADANGQAAGFIARINKTGNANPTGTTTFKNCANTGAISIPGTGGVAGFIAWSVAPLSFTDCANTGTLTNSTGNPGAGNNLSPYTNKTENNCENSATKVTAISNSLVTPSLASIVNDLTTAVSESKAATQGGAYTTATKNAYDAAISEAETLLSTNGSKLSMVTSVSKIAKAERELVHLLDGTIATADTKQEKDFISSTWAPFAEALAEAKIAQKSGTPAEKAAANTALTTAMNALVSRPVLSYTELQAAIDEANGLTATDYTNESWATLQNALSAAELAKTNSTTQDQVNAATNALNAAIQNLQDRPTISYDAINQAIANAEATYTDSSIYTEDSWNAYQTALAKAKNASTLADTQQGVDDLKAALENAISGLTLKPIEYGELNTAISDAKKLDETKYTPTSWDKLEEALAKAEDALNADDQATVDTAVSELRNAINSLVKTSTNTSVDYSTLNSTISNVNSLNESDYTEDSWSALQIALMIARSAQSSGSQSTIDSAAQALSNAIAALESKTAPAPTPTPDEGDNTTEDEGDIPSEDETQPEETEPKETEAPKATETEAQTEADTEQTEKKGGCSSSITAATVVVATVLALGAGISFKKKED